MKESQSELNSGVEVGVGSLKNRGVGVGAFVYRLHSPGIYDNFSVSGYKWERLATA
jgi:hypothetical protein